jgi:hypothetical protein
MECVLDEPGLFEIGAEKSAKGGVPQGEGETTCQPRQPNLVGGSGGWSLDRCAGWSGGCRAVGAGRYSGKQRRPEKNSSVHGDLSGRVWGADGQARYDGRAKLNHERSETGT